jgi:cytosine deaminase
MLAIRNARLAGAGHEGDGLTDLLVENGCVAQTGAAGSFACPSGAVTHDARGGLLLPCFVDIHTHIDKSHVVGETGAVDGDLFAAIERMAVHRAGWTADRVAARMQRALGEAWGHGTRALRTHLDWFSVEEPLSLAVFEDARRHWAGRVELQAVALVPIDLLAADGVAASIARRLAAAGAIMGAFVYRQPEMQRGLERAFRSAAEAGIGLDIHVDEGLHADADGLAVIARLARDYGMAGRVVCGHACSLSVQPRDQALRTLDACAAAGVTLVALPTTNAYLQGSWNGTPIERGITLVNEARAAGVRVCFATDNVADTFYPYGGYDLLDTFEKAVVLAHLKAPQGWLDAVSTVPAAAMGLDGGDPFRAGVPADWLLFKARDMAELLSPHGKSPAGRCLIRRGEMLDVPTRSG